jgi:hypothetical protein
VRLPATGPKPPVNDRGSSAPTPRNAADGAAWLHVARQILAGEFVGADRSTVESLTIGLRGIRHPLCRQALAQLNPQRPNSIAPCTYLIPEFLNGRAALPSH